MGRGTAQPPPFGQLGQRPQGLPTAFDPARAQAAFDQFRADHPFPNNLPPLPQPPSHIPSPISGSGGRPDNADFLFPGGGHTGGVFPGGGYTGGTFPGGGGAFTGGTFPGGGRADVSPTVRPSGGMLPRSFSPTGSPRGSGANPIRSLRGSNQ